MMLQVVFSIVMWTALLGSFGMLVRNKLVYDYRGRVIDGIYHHHLQLLEQGDFNPAFADADWKAFESVSYNAMNTQFWRPRKSFFPAEFLERIGLDG